MGKLQWYYVLPFVVLLIYAYVFPTVASAKEYAWIGWWAADNSPITPFAAEELQSYISAMTGNTLPVRRIKPEQFAGGLRFKHGLLISSTEETTEIAPQFDKNMDDGYVIHPTANGIVLLGTNPQNVLYAAYHLLEIWGVRFFAPDFYFYDGKNEYVPSHSELAMPDTDIIESPALQFRKKYIEEGITHTVDNLIQLVDWMAKNRMNILVSPRDYQGNGRAVWDKYIADGRLIQEMAKRGIKAEVGGHGYQSFIPAKEFPDFYEQGKGFPCMSNPTALAAYIERVQSYLSQHPEISIIDAWPPDGANWCAKDLAAYGTPQNVAAAVATKLAASLAESHPHVLVEYLAYLNYQQVPTVNITNNLLVDFAEYDRSYAVPIFASAPGSKNEYFSKTLQDWLHATNYTGPVSVYTYYRKYSWRSHPTVLYRLIAAEIPYYASLGVAGLGSYSEPGDWMTYELTHYLVARLSWNPKTDPDLLLQDYLVHRYGIAADSMRHYFSWVEDAGRSLFYSPSGALDPAAGNVAALKAAYEAYQKAASVIRQSKQLAANDTNSLFFLTRLDANLNYAINDVLFLLRAYEGDTAQAIGAGMKANMLISAQKLNGTIVDRNLAGRYASLPKNK